VDEAALEYLLYERGRNAIVEKSVKLRKRRVEHDPRHGQG
jgi:hypothetical protein